MGNESRKHESRGTWFLANLSGYSLLPYVVLVHAISSVLSASSGSTETALNMVQGGARFLLSLVHSLHTGFRPLE